MNEPANEQRLTAFIFMVVLAGLLMSCAGLGIAFLSWIILR
jgi:hypothetical protein